jgi:hypothetical protein
MVKNKWINALLFVGIGLIIGLGIGMSSARMFTMRSMAAVPRVYMPGDVELEELEEFEFEVEAYEYSPGWRESDGDQSGHPGRSSRGNQNRTGRIVVEQVHQHPTPARMPFMTRRPFGFGFGRGVLAVGLIGLGIALLLMRRKSKPPAPVVEEAPPPSDEDK